MTENPDKAVRLSPSAMRDYQFCGQYYRWRKVNRVKPKGLSPLYLIAGTLVHESYYYSRANPKKEGYLVSWELTGHYDPERSRKMFKALWTNDPSALTEEQLTHYHLLAASITPWSEVYITTGQKKATKDPDPVARKAGWYTEFSEMLEEALKVELPGKVKEFERRVEFDVGGVPFLGFIDIVLEQADGTEAYVDIKTGMNKPSAEKLEFNRQMQVYYFDGPGKIYLWHLKTGLYPIERNHALMEGISGSAPMMAEMIAAGIYLPRHDEECGSCVFKSQCFLPGE